LEQVDLLDASAVKKAVRGVRHVFHLAYGKDGDSRRDVTVDGTRNVVEAAIEEGCDSIVILSTAYVFGRPCGMVTEQSSYQPAGGEYGKFKAEMERWCLNRARGSGSTRIVVLNPTCVYGPWGATYSELPAKLARGGAFGWLEGGDGNANYNFVSNLIDAILLASASREAHGERFLINDGVVTWREFLEPLVTPWQQDIPSFTKDDLSRMERDGRLSVQKAIRKLLADPGVRAIFRQTAAGVAVTSIARRYLPTLIPGAAPNGSSASSGDAAMAAPHPPAWLADLFGNSSTVYSSEKAHRILGWHPKVDLQEGQRRTRDHLNYLFSLPR